MLSVIQSQNGIITKFDVCFPYADSSRPSLGLRLEARGGDDVWCSTKRHISVDVRCPDRHTAPHLLLTQSHPTGMAQETSHTGSCSYNATIVSLAGCPVQCLRDSLGVCSQRGVCVIMPGEDSVRCICDAGSHGALCQYDDV